MITDFFLDLCAEQKENQSNIFYRLEEDSKNDDKKVFYLKKADGSEEILSRDAYFMFARKRVHDHFPKETEYGAQIKWIVDGNFEAHTTLLLNRMEATDFTEEQRDGLKKWIEACLVDIHNLPKGKERAINIKTIYHMTHTNYHYKKIIKEIMLELEYRFYDGLRRDEYSSPKSIFYHLEFCNMESPRDVYDRIIEPKHLDPSLD